MNLDDFPPIKTLLARDPEAAIVRMFNLANGTSYREDGFLFGLPSPVPAYEGDILTTTVTMTGKTPSNGFEDQYTPLDVTFTYQRVSLKNYMGMTFSGYHPILPLSTQNVLDAIQAQTGQAFFPDDIVLTEVTIDNRAAFRIDAKPESLRWAGSVTIRLGDPTAFTDLFDSRAMENTPDNSQVTYGVNESVPLINLTEYRDMAMSLRVGDLGQERQDLVTLFNLGVGDPTTSVVDLETWSVSTTPSEFNLYNAKVVSRVSGQSVNPGVPELDTALVIQLDPLYCVNFDGTPVVMPYCTADWNTLGFTDMPRLVNRSALSFSDGTAFNSFLGTLEPDAVISTVQAGGVALPPDFLIDGSFPWVDTAGLVLPTNLEAAVVKENRLRLDNDPSPANANLDRMLTIEMPPTNSFWSGEYRFFYKGIIQMPVRTLTSSIGGAAYASFAPTEGTPPFDIVLQTGTSLPPGLSLDAASGDLTGTPTALGDYNYVIEITDADWNLLAFPIVHHVVPTIGKLALSGSLPVAISGQDYSGFLDIAGGLAPYQAPTVIAGFLPGSIAMAVTGKSIHFTGIWGTPDVYRFSITLTSSDDQSVTGSYAVAVNPAQGV